MPNQQAEAKKERQQEKSKALIGEPLGGMYPCHCCPAHSFLRTCEATGAIFSMAQVTFGHVVKTINLILVKCSSCNCQRQEDRTPGYQASSRGDERKLLKCRLLTGKLSTSRKANLNSWGFKM